MSVQTDPRIRSEGDLEAAFLYETHDLLATLIGSEYYQLLGDEVRFHTSSRFNDFVVHVDELLARGREKLPVGILAQRVSLLEVGKWFATRHPAECADSGFTAALQELDRWLNHDPAFRFWGAEIAREIEFPLLRAGMTSYAANLNKHRLLRLGSVFKNLRSLMRDHGVTLSEQEIVSIRDSFTQELRNRLLYLSTWLVELLGKYFLALNEIVVSRSSRAGTNDVDLMPMPEGITSDTYRSMYGATLVFQNYTRSRIENFTPATPTYCKAHY